MPIRVLDPQVVAQIAAGEVVERPASVVKELVENSLDAGASRVAVEVRGGGVGLVRVVDNGEGIPADEVELAFQRHATSKLTGVQDLSAIATLGFRGEALPSIAAVAHVSMRTRARDASTGVLVEVREGRVVRREPHGAPVGTSVTIRHLFRNVPARFKFLKSAATESGRIQDEMSRFVLAYPQVAFTLEMDGRRVLASPGSGVQREAIAAVYGADVARVMLEITPDQEGGPVSVTGFLSPPSLHRSNRGAISLFVNGRWVQSRTLSYAVDEAYHSLLPQRRHPIVVLFLQVRPEDVDVNVHPAKREVRFRREGEVFASVQRAVRATLVGGAPVHQMTASTGRRAETAWSPSRTQVARPRPGQGEEALTLIPFSEEREEARPGGAATPRSVLPLLRVLGQAQALYIVAEGPDGVYLIDQHAAHERVLYERIRQQVAEGSAEQQGLLEPTTVELSPALEEALEAGGDALAKYGFAVEAFGPGAYLIRAVPASLRAADPGQALAEVLEALQAGAADVTAQEEGLAAVIACHSAVRAGQVLSQEEMVELVRGLERATEPHTCPHGRPTVVHLSAAHLEREFGRR